MLVVVIFSVIGAALNAASTAMQRIAAGHPAASELFKRKFVVAISKHPLFLGGMALQIIASVCQLIALNNGPLTIVQPLMTLDLVFLFLIIHYRYGRQTTKRDWLSVLAVMVGLSTLFLISSPVDGRAPYHLEPWLIMLSIIGLIIVLSSLVVSKIKYPMRRAGLAALAAASCYAANDGLAKLNLNLLKVHSFGYLLTDWPIYALIVFGLLSIYLMENTYGAGPVKASQPVNEVVEPTFTVLMGMAIFGDSVTHTPLAIAAECLSLGLLLYGVLSLATSKELTKTL